MSLLDWLPWPFSGWWDADEEKSEVDVSAQARVLLAGPTGVGKSTLVNAMLGQNRAATGAGEPVSHGTIWYPHPRAPIAFCDSEGIELKEGERQVDELRTAVGDAANPHRPHVVWLCVSGQAHRFFSDGDGSEGAVLRLLSESGIPAILVVTKAEPEDVMAPPLGSEGAAAMLVDVARVCVEPLLSPDGRVAIPAHGLETLKRTTLALLPPNLRPSLAEGWLAV